MPGTPSARCFTDVLEARLGRRDALKVMTAAGACLLSPGSFAVVDGGSPGVRKTSRFTFEEIEHGVGETHVVAPGYDCEVLIRWGDAVLPGAPSFDPRAQTAASQARQFGYNNDHIAYLPVPRGSNAADRGLLCVNHEYALPVLMFPTSGTSRAKIEIEQAAVGCSIVEAVRDDGRWRIARDSRYARRITARTPCRIEGPAAGSERLRTREDPGGRWVLGTLSNCGGGVTPWGTWLTAEENINVHFGGDVPARHPEARNHARYGVAGKPLATWHRFEPRWDAGREPNEPNRFGWIVEIDPYDPWSTPVKRTALGRFFHEGAEVVVNADGRLVVYMADDKAFEHIYRFVSARRFDPFARRPGGGLLDDGTLYAARFEDDGALHWRPLTYGVGPLTPANGFHGPADVMIETRVAALMCGATPMDRPEGIAVHPLTGRVFVTLTHNRLRRPEQTDAVNRRAANIWGQIVELVPPGGDHAADVFAWEVLVQCGPRDQGRSASTWNERTSRHGWFSGPDNLAFDHRGGLWVCTDQSGLWAQASGTADGLWAVETEGERRATGRMFFRVPVGAEPTGPAFTPDDQTLFLSVQHPAADGTRFYSAFGRDSSYGDPATRWPDFTPEMPPRPAVVAVTRRGGGTIGG